MKKKMFGALALSATLAMGCAVPAFAAETTGTPTKVDTSGNANTEVYVTADVKQLNVEVPLKYAMSANVNGGEAVAPNPSVYGIENKGTIDAYLVSASAAAEPGWGLKTTAFAAEGTPADASSTKGDVCLMIQPGTWASNKFTPLASTNSTAITDPDNAVTFDNNWKLEKGKTTALESNASTSVISGMEYQAQEKALTVTYTISATAPSAGA